ncbi:2'-5' RNA ligase family protein [Lapillicoccus jejuensis]|uniref:2'-5' RNA ligase n=1 Tax=Lapillicoccus jejuensis TaxID=402171 RepID=A0A542E0B7_9MICO|nr:hypothetical protein [Lapillicoccus jejuensis]TQJ08791.1 2'-5' RNA ligase [Lapillicoccus jejuensis]
MILFAAVVPPPPVVEAALARVRRALAPAPAPPRRWWQRGGRSTAEAAPPIEVLPADRVVLTVARFGNLTTPDAHRLTSALVEAATDWSTPTVRIAGASVWESSRIPQLALDLSGDLDGLHGIARDVRATVQGLGLFLDRRDFRPSLPVAPLPEGGADDEVAAVAAAVAGEVGEPFTVTHLSLLRQATETSPLLEHARVPLSSDAAGCV